jgi:uncharacterized C2H2 Zn-finger protein
MATKDQEKNRRCDGLTALAQTPSSQSERRGASYTARLVEHLEENKVSKKTLDLIKDFASAEREKIEAERKETEGLMNFGKYKNKRFEDIYKIDKSYIEWLNKNNKYLREDGRKIVAELLSGTS